MHKKNKFERLGVFYILALTGIAVTIALTQLFIQGFINRQQDDSRVINVAGRQRMLSQKISKTALEIQWSAENNPAQLAGLRRELDSALNLWIRSHEALLHGDEELGLHGKNSEAIQTMFVTINPNYDSIVHSGKEILSLMDREGDPDFIPALRQHVVQIFANEDHFLRGMDKIVFQYDLEARTKVDTLKQTEWWLFGITLLIIVFEFLFIFRPIAKNVRETVNELIASEAASMQMTQENNKLYRELEKSYQDLEAVKLEPEQPTVYLKLDDVGNVIYASDKFIKLLEYESKADVPGHLIQLLQTDGYSSEFITDIMKIVTGGNTWTGEVKLTGKSGDFFWFDMSIVPVSIHGSHRRELLVVARDITETKEARLRSREINRENIEKKVKEQKYRSVLILEGQEEERKRISRDIHDGIGQMLTAMKMTVEAISPIGMAAHSKVKLDHAKHLLRNVIREVRRVSFNLTPSSLMDFGLTPAIKKFCSEVGSLSGIEVNFENRTGFINRLDTIVENNLYRIIQEAVNNAVKYARAKKIDVIFDHNASNLNIVISDDGKGFDYEGLQKAGYFDQSGHGVFNMKERAAFIDAGFSIQTKVGEGTVITINYPLS